MTNIYSAPQSELVQNDYSEYSDKDLKRISNSWRHLRLVLIIFCVFSVLPAALFGVLSIAVPTEEYDGFLGLTVLFGIFSGIYLLVSWGTLNLKRWGRITGIAISGLSLLSIPVGTLLGAVALVSYSRLKSFFVPGGKERLQGLLSEWKRRKT